MHSHCCTAHDLEIDESVNAIELESGSKVYVTACAGVRQVRTARRDSPPKSTERISKRATSWEGSLCCVAGPDGFTAGAPDVT